MRKLIVFLVCLLLAAFLLSCTASAEEGIRGYVKGDGWQYLQMGEYPYEEDGTVRPVLWRVMSADSGRILLLTEYIIDVKQIIFETDQKIIDNHSFRRISAYNESDLYPWLNTECMDILFGSDSLRNALIDDPDLGVLHPMTRDEALTPAIGFSASPWDIHLERQAVCTPYARSKGLYVDTNRKSPWWCVAIKGVNDYKFGLVGYDGHISWGAYTNIKVGGLRLSVYLDPDRVRVTGGSGSKEDPFTLEYTGSVLPESIPPDGDTTPVEETAAGWSEETVPPPEEPDVPPEETKPQDAGEPRAEGTALISLLGDCSIGDSYSSIRNGNSYHSVVAREGYAWPFSKVVQYLEEDDLTVANLEVVLTTNNNHKDILYPLRALPEHVNILIEGSVEAVNTVNNHCYDYFREGYAESLATLDEAGVAHFGSVYYKKKDGFDDLLVRDVNGIRFGFIGITYPQQTDQQAIIDRIAKLKGEEGCDIVIVSLHWGRETYKTPESGQLTYARKLINGGADVIYGHHPHVLQPIVFYNGKPILFSTGNFTFGSMSNVDPHTGIFRLTYQRTGDRVFLSQLQVIPCQTSGKGDYRPFELTDEAERKKTFQLLVKKKPYAGCENPPDSFLETGIIRLDENGTFIPEM